MMRMADASGISASGGDISADKKARGVKELTR